MDSFKGKKVTVMGLGLHGGGLGTVRFLIREGAKDILITDVKPKQKLLVTLSKIPRRGNIRYVLGRHRLVDFEGRDAIIKNPDVPPHSPFLQHAQDLGIPVLSDVGIFFGRVGRPIIGVTGTKGKSTTASLIALVLATRYLRTLLAGNIRKSVLEIIDAANRADFVVLELSSFQLEDLAPQRQSPHIAVITSLAPDHLNRHKTFSQYRRIKGLIAKFQTPDDFVVFFRGRGLESLAGGFKGQKVLVPPSAGLARKIASVNPYLEGHMGDAAILALHVGRILGVPFKKGLLAFKRFKPLEGRREVVRIFAGIRFINDTTATAPAAAAADLEKFAREAHSIHPSKKRGNVILIAGGVDKKLPYADFSRSIARFAAFAVFLPGSGTDKILRSLPRRARGRVMLVSSMREAVSEARRRAERGDIVLLAPGAASFNLFLHEFHRGAEFVKYVKRLR